MDRTVNNIQLALKLVCMLRTYRTCNLTVRFSKYEFYNKLLGGIILLRITPGVTRTQPYIYIFSLDVKIASIPPNWANSCYNTYLKYK